MNDATEQALRTRFAQQRREDHNHAPAWRDAWLQHPLQPQRHTARWVYASLATACLVALAAFLAVMPGPEPQLSEVLPALFEAPSAELFADLPRPEAQFIAFEAPSDFLLPTHLNLNLIP